MRQLKLEDLRIFFSSQKAVRSKAQGHSFQKSIIRVNEEMFIPTTQEKMT